jgi:hypothetical protein
MTVVTARIQVAEDGTISGRAPIGQLPPGEHEAAITVVASASPPWPGKPFTMESIPVHDEPWDDSISLRREDMYDDEGRLR